MWWGKGPSFVYFKISLARAETTNMALDFSVSLGALYFPGSAPILAAGHQIWENRSGGGWVLRAASHGLSDLLTPLGLRPQALPTLVNKEAPFKAVPQWAAASPPEQALVSPGCHGGNKPG